MEIWTEACSLSESVQSSCWQDHACRFFSESLNKSGVANKKARRNENNIMTPFLKWVLEKKLKTKTST